MAEHEADEIVFAAGIAAPVIHDNIQGRTEKDSSPSAHPIDLVLVRWKKEEDLP